MANNTEQDIDDLPTPGSLILVDLANEQNTHAEIRLSPIPSNDVNDPLRWSWRRKQIAHACLFLYVLTVGVACTMVYSILVPIQETTGISVSTLNAGTGYMFLLLGWGGLITQPLALAYGKRGVYLISQVGSIVVLIWSVFIRTDSQWLANKVLQGFFCSPIEMLIETSIGDLFFAHERGFYIGIYAFVLFGSNYLAPILAGFIYQSLGYAWVFYIAALIQGLGLLLSFFFMEETNYKRDISELNEDHTDGVPLPTVPSSNSISGDKLTLDSMDESGDKIAVTSVEHQMAVVQTLDAGQLHGAPIPYGKRLLFFNQNFADLRQLSTMIYRPLLLLCFPVIFWAGFQYGAFLVWYNVLNATASPIFSAAPYNFKASSVGLTYLGPLIGTMFSAVYSGYFGDRFLLWSAKRRKGAREPEDRLWLLSICVILVPSALLLWGVGAAYHIHWIGLVFGGGMLACSSAIGGALVINYALDSYKDLSGEVMLSVTLVRNSLSFAIGYAITPWLHLGLQDTFVSAAFVGMAITSTFVIFIRYGKHFRHHSRKAYWRYVEASVSTSH